MDKMTRLFLILSATASLAAVCLAADSPASEKATNAPPLAYQWYFVDAPSFRATVLEKNVAYLRLDQVTGNLADDLSAAQNALAATNKTKITGTILDLRFADGNASSLNDVAASLSSRNLPLVILVNAATHGAAADLAAKLRTDDVGILIGGTNQSLQPDIVVRVNPADEKKFLANPYALPANPDANLVSATNDYVPFVDHTSEADLVRQKIKDGDEDEDNMPAMRPAPPTPVIRDPVLARGVDFLKALAVLPPARG